MIFYFLDDHLDDAFWDAQFTKRIGAEHDDIKGNGCCK